jgi:hypothetical protein
MCRISCFTVICFSLDQRAVQTKARPKHNAGNPKQVLKSRATATTAMERAAGTDSACVNDVPMPMNEYISRKV